MTLWWRVSLEISDKRGLRIADFEMGDSINRRHKSNRRDCSSSLSNETNRGGGGVVVVARVADEVETEVAVEVAVVVVVVAAMLLVLVVVDSVCKKDAQVFNSNFSVSRNE